MRTQKEKVIYYNNQQKLIEREFKPQKVLVKYEYMYTHICFLNNHCNQQQQEQEIAEEIKFEMKIRKKK